MDWSVRGRKGYDVSCLYSLLPAHTLAHMQHREAPRCYSSFCGIMFLPSLPLRWCRCFV